MLARNGYVARSWPFCGAESRSSRSLWRPLRDRDLAKAPYRKAPLSDGVKAATVGLRVRGDPGEEAPVLRGL